MDFQDEKSLQARLFKISTEQQALLSRDSAWHISPSNIPLEVVEHVKAHLARQRAAASAKSTENVPSIQDANEEEEDDEEKDEETHASRSPSVAPEAEPFDSQPEDSCDEDGENLESRERSKDTPCSPWPSSPSHHMYPPGQMPEEQDVDEFLTQLPENSPPRPTAIKSSKFVRPTYHFPPSSNGQEEEDELEIDIPTRLEFPVLPINRPAVHVMATPPSAQVVPCSLEPARSHLHDQSKPRGKTVAKQTRYAPVTALYRPLREIEPELSIAEADEKKSGHDSTDDSQPHTFPTDSSSIIPSTHQASIQASQVCRDDRPTQTEEEPESSTTSTKVAPPSIRQDAPVKPSNPDILSAQKPVASTSSPPAALPLFKAGTRQSLVTKDQGKKEQILPYAQFCNTYPSYTGSIQSFITACIYIQLQQKKIRSSLYDDFIRAWHDGYYAYVKQCDKAVPPVQAAHAYAWYNEMDDDPIYISRIITKQNLQFTLDCYPEEVENAKHSLGIAPQDRQKVSKQAENPAPSPQPLEEKPKDTERPVDALVIEDDAIEEDPALVEDDMPESTFLDQEEVVLPAVDFSKSMNAIDLRPQPPQAATVRSLARSFSDAARHKRKASLDIVDKAPKKALITVTPTFTKPEAPPSPSGVSVRSNASRTSLAGTTASLSGRTPSSTDVRKRRYADDPLKRKQQFAKFLRRNKTILNTESIMSSAPTSAQREG